MYVWECTHDRSELVCWCWVCSRDPNLSLNSFMTGACPPDPPHSPKFTFLKGIIYLSLVYSKSCDHSFLYRISEYLYHPQRNPHFQAVRRSLPLPSRLTTDLPLTAWICLFWTFHVNTVMNHVAFGSRFFHSSSCPPNSSMFSYVLETDFFLWIRSMIGMYCILFIYSLVGIICISSLVYYKIWAIIHSTILVEYFAGFFFFWCVYLHF